ncbi:MAG TPA: DUF1345 domain-containing protein [Bacteroidota bacterium]
MPSKRLTSLLRVLTRLDSHHRVFISFFFAVIVHAAAPRDFPFTARLALTWTAFAGAMLLLAWGVILSGDPGEVRRSAVLQDAGRSLIFTVVLLASCGSFWVVWVLIGLARGQSGPSYAFYMTLAPVSVVFSWCLVHTVFALRYAHIYYGAGHIHGTHHGGLEFPGDHLPDYMDFAYYSFVVGMTAQVSDVPVTSKRLRRLTLLHGLISFAFNTIILALTINALATATLS